MALPPVPPIQGDAIGILFGSHRERPATPVVSRSVLPIIHVSPRVFSAFDAGISSYQWSEASLSGPSIAPNPRPSQRFRIVPARRVAITIETLCLLAFSPKGSYQRGIYGTELFVCQAS